MRRRMILPFLVSLILLLTLMKYGCSSSTPVGPNAGPSGALLEYSGCKDDDAASRRGAQGSMPSPAAQECLYFSFDGRTLELRHVNAAFNCCLETIVCEFSFEGDTIVIDETGILANGQGCFCECLYDLEMEIGNLAGAIYTVTLQAFEEPIILDLRAPTSGVHCETRSDYPWT